MYVCMNVYAHTKLLELVFLLLSTYVFLYVFASYEYIYIYMYTVEVFTQKLCALPTLCLINRGCHAGLCIDILTDVYPYKAASA